MERVSRSATNLFSLFLALGVFILSVILLTQGKSIFIPFVIGLFFAYFIDALSEAIQGASLSSGWHPPRFLALLLSICAFLVVLGFLVNLVTNNLARVVDLAPTYQENLNALVQKAAALAGLKRSPTLSQVVSGINFSGYLSGTAGALASLVGNAFTIFLYVVFILIEKASLSEKISALFPDAERETLVRQTLDRIGEEIQKYVLLKTFVSILTAGISYLIMESVGVDLAGFWAVLIFILNFIPYLGSIVAVLLPTLLTLIQFQALAPFLIVAGGLTLVQLGIGNVVEPRLLGKSLNLSPLMILLSLAVWGSIWGIVGSIVCVPLMVMVMIIFEQIPQTRPIAILMSQTGRIRSIDRSPANHPSEGLRDETLRSTET